MPYRKDIEEMSGGDRYAPVWKAKTNRPRGFFENEIANTPWAILFAFTTCCMPIGIIVTAIAWRKTKDPRIRTRAKFATLFPAILVVLYCTMCAIAIIVAQLFE